MKILAIPFLLSSLALMGCQSAPPKAAGWNAVDDSQEVQINHNLPQLIDQMNNKNVWSD